MRVTGVVVIACLLSACVKEYRSNLVIARSAPECGPGADPARCYQQQVSDDRPGRCFDQRPNPGEQIVDCRDESKSHLTPAGRAWIIAGGIAGGVLLTTLLVFYVYTFVTVWSAVGSGGQ